MSTERERDHGKDLVKNMIFFLIRYLFALNLLTGNKKNDLNLYLKDRHVFP